MGKQKELLLALFNVFFKSGQNPASWNGAGNDDTQGGDTGPPANYRPIALQQCGTIVLVSYSAITNDIKADKLLSQNQTVGSFKNKIDNIAALITGLPTPKYRRETYTPCMWM